VTNAGPYPTGVGPEIKEDLRPETERLRSENARLQRELDEALRQLRKSTGGNWADTIAVRALPWIVSSCQIRFDRFGIEHNSGFSTVLIAEIDNRALNWGNASSGGKTSPIVALKLGFMEFVVDEEVVGHAKLKALRENFYKPNAKLDAKLIEDTTPEDRRDAAEAAIAAEHFEIANWIEPKVLFDVIVLNVLETVATKLQTVTLENFLSKILLQAASEAAWAKRQGYNDAKVELRNWLGVDGYGGVFPDNK